MNHYIKYKQNETIFKINKFYKCKIENCDYRFCKKRSIIQCIDIKTNINESLCHYTNNSYKIPTKLEIFKYLIK